MTSNNTTETTSLLEVTDLSKTFYGLRAVDEVSFDSRPGEVLGIIGPNGAGKTTLVNCVTGVLRADSGSILHRGARVEHLSIQKRVERGILRTFQHVRLFGELDAIENVRLGSYAKDRPNVFSAFIAPRSRRERAAMAAATEYLKNVGLEAELWRKPVASLSQSQQRLVELARIRASSPDVLMLDEPTVGMTAREREQLSEWIASMLTSGTAVVLVSHDMPFVMAHCDRVLVMNFGKTLAFGTAEQVHNDEAVIAAYFGTTEVRDRALGV
jgi:branched-chain amino acid transport system permease protein